MASTTEELTSQSDQLVSALAFFRTGEEGAYCDGAHRGRQTGQARRGCGRQGGKAERPRRPACCENDGGQGRGRVNLRLKDKDKEKADDLDKEFERF